MGGGEVGGRWGGDVFAWISHENESTCGVCMRVSLCYSISRTWFSLLRTSGRRAAPPTALQHYRSPETRRCRSRFRPPPRIRGPKRSANTIRPSPCGLPLLLDPRRSQHPRVEEHENHRPPVGPSASAGSRRCSGGTTCRSGKSHAGSPDELVDVGKCRRSRTVGGWLRLNKGWKVGCC